MKCCTRLAENTERPKIAKNWPCGHHRTSSSGCIFATKACIDNRKKLLNSNISSTCPHHMANFGHSSARLAQSGCHYRADIINPSTEFHFLWLAV